MSLFTFSESLHRTGVPPVRQIKIISRELRSIIHSLGKTLKVIYRIAACPNKGKIAAAVSGTGEFIVRCSKSGGSIRVKFGTSH